MAPPQHHARHTIGLLTTDLSDSRIMSVYTGILALARQADLNVLCYCTGKILPQASMRESMHRITCELISPDRLDGLITMQYWNSLEYFTEFCRDYIDMPICTATRNYAGFNGVAVDTYNGCRQLVEHMILHHGYRRIVFVRSRLDAETHTQRYQAFLDVCAEQKLAIQPEWIITFEDWHAAGNLREDPVNRGKYAVDTLLDERGLMPGRDFDAIISSSEPMCLHIMRELQLRGFHIPRDIAVVSDENTLEGAMTTPPLTTVGVNWYEMGWQSARILLERMRNPQYMEHMILPTKLVVRHSCGCHSPEVEQAGMADMQSRYRPPQLPPLSRHQVVHELHTHFAAFTDTAHEIACALYDAFMADITGITSINARESRFLVQLETLITSGESRHEQLLAIQSTFACLHHHALSLFVQDLRRLHQAESLLQQGQIITSQLSQHAQAARRIEQDRLLSTLQDMGRRMMGSFDIPELIQILADRLPSLGISHAYLSLYEHQEHADGMARLMLAYDETGILPISYQGICFPAVMLVPQNLLAHAQRWDMVVEPLHFGEDQIGFVLFESSAPDPRIYDLLRSEISNAIKGALLMQRVNKRSADLEQTNQSLQESLRSLTLFQNRLVQSEKMAAMGELVAGLAHEINNPLGVVVTAASCMEDATKAQRTALASNTLRKSELVNYMEDATESMRIIRDNLARLSSILQSFKRVSVDQSFEEKRSFLFYDYLQDIRISLRPQLKKTRHTLEIHCPQNLRIHSYPGAYYQIITNLVINSLRHGFEDIPAGMMRLDISMDADALLIVYRDNGMGMNDTTRSQIFDPFFTTKRGQGGTGLGMNIVANLVTEQLHGSITCDSQPGLGVRFDIRIPDVVPPLMEAAK